MQSITGKGLFKVLAADTQALMAKINKARGEGTVIVAADLHIPKRFTSGSLSLDLALGGGWPGNQWVEILGRESAGKTAVALKTVAANQRQDPDFTTLWVAGEHYDSDQAAALGVDNERVLVVPTQNMEFAFQVIIEWAASRAVDCIVLDSYPALLPDEESEKAMDEFVTAAGARRTGQFFRKVGRASSRAMDGSERPFLGIFINQFRDKIGSFSRFGTPQTSPGGNGKNYSFFTRLEVARDEWITEKRPGHKDPVKVGQVIKLRTIKNKSAAPQQTAFIDFYFRNAPLRGFYRGDYDTGRDYFTMAVLFGVITVSGGWYYHGDRKWQGKDNVMADMRAEPDLQETIAAQVLEAARNPHQLEEASA